jgi:transposase-like protein
MPRKGHSEEKIVYALRQVEAGKKVTEVCPEMGVSPQAFYSWKRRYAGVGLNELVLTHYKRAAPFRVGFECRLRTRRKEAQQMDNRKYIGMDVHQGMSSQGWCIQRASTPPGQKLEAL